MARVDFSGVPQVAPRTESPDDYEHVQASPAAFGAQLAQGGEALGHGVSDVGKFFGEVQTDDAVNGAMTSVNQTLDHFRTLNGAEALRAQAGTQQQIDEAFTNGRDGLQSAQQQYQYDQAVRAYRERYVNGLITSHADQSAKQFQQETNKNSLALALTGVTNMADNPDMVETFKHDARMAAYRQVQSEGNASDPDMVQAALNGADRAVYKTQIETVGLKDPGKALEIADAHKDVLGLDYPELSNRLRVAHINQQGLGVADQAFSATAQQIDSPSASSNTIAVREAILQQESGNKGPNPGQVQPGTFAQYAKPGEDLNNPADARAVSTRIVDDLSHKFNDDPARIAVGYFSGPGNVAPAGSPTPWVSDVKDANGKSVSSYVSGVTQRLGTNGPMLAAKANVYDRILASTEGQPLVRQAALKEVDQRYRASEIADLADQKARKEAQDTALRGYGDMIRSGKTDLSWRNNPSLTEENIEHLDKLAIDTAKETLTGKPGDWGPGFDNVQQRIANPAAPNGIRNQAQLLALQASGDLNPEGFNKASEFLTKINQPHAKQDAETEAELMKIARRKVTLEDENEPGNTYAVGGLDNWVKARPKLDAALQKGYAAGATIQQMMDPDDKFSVWPTIKPYLPTPAQTNAAVINRDDIETRKAALRAWVAADPTRRAEGERQAVANGWAIAAPVPSSQVPVEGD